MRHHIAYLLLTLLPLFAAIGEGGAYAQQPDSAYSNADYATAIQGYKAILAQSATPTAELYYNLGCAYFKNGDIAQARLCFERAYRLKPQDADIRYNIAIAESHTVDKLPDIRTPFFTRVVDRLSHSFSIVTWLTLGLLFLVLTLVAVLYYLLGRQRSLRVASFYTAIPSFFLVLLTNLMVYRVYTFTHNSSEAILLSSVVTVKSSPDASAKDIVVVHGGLKVKVLQTLGAYSEVHLPDNTIGWIPTSDYELINTLKASGSKH